jgi:hypothetical protein
MAKAAAWALAPETGDVMDETYDKAFQKTLQYGDQWAVAGKTVEKLEAAADALFARLYRESEEKTVEARKIATKAHPEYQELRSNIAEARARERSFRVHYDVGRAYLDWMRTCEATRREEMRLTR